MTKVITIGSIREYLAALEKFEQQHIAQWFYRGHNESNYKLVPSLYRLDVSESFATWDELEEYMMQIFRREAQPYLPTEPTDDLSWLSLAQHHGLPTRLLDWTTNPLVALYFAVEKKPDRNADVWCMGFPSTNNCLPESTLFSRRKNLAKMRVVYWPRHFSARVTNQSGCFTVHDSPVPLNWISGRKRFFGFVKLRIKSSKKSALLNELYNLGIHKGFIYPGLDGLAKRIYFEVTNKHLRYTLKDQNSNNPKFA